MIELTKEEAMTILIALSRIDGFLFSLHSNTGAAIISGELEEASGILVDKINGNK